MDKTKTKRLGELLLDFNYITQKQLEEAIEYQQKNNVRLGEALVELNAVEASISLIEPLMIVFLAGVVGFIVISIVLPMFEMFQQF